MAVPGSLDQERIVEPAREVPIASRSEVLVVGGGPSGVGAALAAARTGARTTDRRFDIHPRVCHTCTNKTVWTVIVPTVLF